MKSFCRYIFKIQAFSRIVNPSYADSTLSYTSSTAFRFCGILIHRGASEPCLPEGDTINRGCCKASNSPLSYIFWFREGQNSSPAYPAVSGGESNSDSPTAVLLFVFFLIFLGLRQQALVICAENQSKKPCCGVRSSFHGAAFRQDKQNHAGNTRWYSQGIFRSIGGK